MLFLSTHKPILGTTVDDDKNKAALYNFHDFTKGGTDIVYQRIASSSRSICKWLVSLTSLIWSMRIPQNKDSSKQSSFQFGMDIVCSLFGPFIQ